MFYFLKKDSRRPNLFRLRLLLGCEIRLSENLEGIALYFGVLERADPLFQLLEAGQPFEQARLQKTGCCWMFWAHIVLNTRQRHLTKSLSGFRFIFVCSREETVFLSIVTLAVTFKGI